MHHTLRLAALLIPVLAAAGCSDFSTEPTRTPTELRVTAESTFLRTGDTLRYEIELIDEAGEAYATIPSWTPPFWSSDRPDRVDLTGGVVRPLMGGQNLLTVELAGLSAELEVRVNPSAMSLSVPLLYITQSVQRRVGDVPVIAGRDGLLRVVVQGDDENYYRPRVRATFHNGGSEVHSEMLELETDGLPTRVFEGNLNLSYDALIPGSVLQPGVSVVIETDPDGVVPAGSGSVLRIPATGTLDLDVREVPPFRLMMVPVDQSVNGRVSRLTQSHAENMVRLAEDIFPMGEFLMEVREPYLTAEHLHADSGWYNLIEDIVLLREDDGSPHYYYGGFDRPQGTSIGGLGYVGYPVSIGMDNQPDVIAHEIGHNLSLPHAPCGNPAGVDTNYPYDGGYVGVYGYDPSTGYLQRPSEKFDLMSYCDPIWISDYNYEKVMAYREVSPYDGAAATTAGLRAARAVGPEGVTPDGTTLVIRGGVQGGQLRLSPALEWNGPATPDAAGGPYTLEGLDDAGAVIFSRAVELRRLDHGDDAHFFAAIPSAEANPDRLARLRLTGPEGSVERGRSSNRLGPLSRRPDVTLGARTGGRGGVRGAPGAGRATAVWDAGAYPLAVVRDKVTGRIRAMSRSGSVIIPDDMDAGRVDVLLSDGIRTHRANVVQQ